MSTEQGGWPPADRPQDSPPTGYPGYPPPGAPFGQQAAPPPGGYPSAPPTSGYPAAPPAYGYPSAPPTSGYPSAPPAYGYPSAPGYGSLPPLADFGTRVLALLIDSAIPFGILLLSVIPLFATLQPGTDSNGDPTMVPSPAGMLFLVLGYLGTFAFSLWNRVFRMGRTGQSIGKKVMHISLVSEATLAPPGAGTTFLREVVNSLASQAFYISYLWPLWDGRRRTLGGLLLKTLVVKV